ncbi:MAG TPA: hypothetical protein VJ747_19065 [Stellaceae bacterium]|nr:hypothetical protein [Stellaceae bacterium]
MRHRALLSLLLPLLLVLAAPAGAQTKPTLREEIDHFTAARRNDYATCAQHIALEYQWSTFLHAAPGPAMTKCARELRGKYDAEIARLEAALRHDKKAQAALRAYYAEWRETVDGLKAGSQPALRANLDRLDSKAAAIRLRQAETKRQPRYGDASHPLSDEQASN